MIDGQHRSHPADPQRADSTWFCGDQHRTHARRQQPPEKQAEQPAAGAAQQDDSTVERIKGLPPALGVILMAAGVVGVLLPGPIGTPLIVAGGLVLAPRAFGKLDDLLKRRYPGLRHQGVKMLERFLDDLQKRYPDDPPANTPKSSS